MDGNLGTSWFSIGDKEGDTSTYTWTSGKGAILVDHVTIYSNSQNSDPSIRSGFTFTSIQVTVLHNGSVTASVTVPYPSTSVDVPLGHVGDTVRLLLIHHTNPACGGIGELQVYGSPVASAPSGGASGSAHSAADAEAIVRAALDREKGPCGMTYTTVTATATSRGWNVQASVTTRGGPGTTTFGVATGSSTLTPEDQLGSEILAGCP